MKLWQWATLSTTMLILFAAPKPALAKEKRYGETFCNQNGFHCIVIQKHATWASLWPDEREREIVMKLNRMNVLPAPGMVIAAPDSMDGKTFMDYSPFPSIIVPSGEKVLVWDPALLAWAAYGPDGKLIRWGPAVGGMDYCADVKRSCRTVTGTFRILFKAGAEYRSVKYPLGCSGKTCASIPYFMMFHAAGYGFHASSDVPGRNASHGCIRLFREDAKWLNTQFVEKGTKVIIRPYP